MDEPNYYSAPSAPLPSARRIKVPPRNLGEAIRKGLWTSFKWTLLILGPIHFLVFSLLFYRNLSIPTAKPTPIVAHFLLLVVEAGVYFFGILVVTMSIGALSGALAYWADLRRKGRAPNQSL